MFNKYGKISKQKHAATELSIMPLYWSDFAKLNIAAEADFEVSNTKITVLCGNQHLEVTAYELADTLTQLQNIKNLIE